MGGWTTKGLWKADGSSGRGMQPVRAVARLRKLEHQYSTSSILYSNFLGPPFG